MADTLSLISIISFVMSGIFFSTAVALFFIFKIPSVLGDLSGRTAKKSIEKMRKNNERTGNKSYSSSNVNLARGKLTEIIKENNRKNQETVCKNDETGLLNENHATSYNELDTGILEGATEVLSDENETVSLNDIQETFYEKKKSNITFTTIDDVVLVHTEEVIP